MKDRPILFSAPMVRAILAGQKQQTRRVIPYSLMQCQSPEDEPETFISWCRYGVKGDRLWVRETFVPEWWEDEPKPPTDNRPIFHHSGDGSEWDNEYWLWPHYKATDPAPKLVYENDDNDDGEPKCKWIPSIHMPRWASRITLEILKIRVEHLQDITHEDAVKEGFPHEDGKAWGRLGFSLTWEKINGPDSWKNNPWVWVIEFCVAGE